MTENTNNPSEPQEINDVLDQVIDGKNEPKQLSDVELEDVSGGIISYSIRDLVNLLPEPTRTIVINKNDHTEQGERDFLAALMSELYINGHDHEGELVSYYYWHHWEPIDSQYRAEY